jgi:hypothetical protein
LQRKRPEINPKRDRSNQFHRHRPSWAFGSIALQVDRAFGAPFNTETHLDILFLDDEADAHIRKSYPPFYTYTGRYH